MSIKPIIYKIGKKAKMASIELRSINSNKKNAAYEFMAKNIKNNIKNILGANEIDIKQAIQNSLSTPLINRLRLNEESISSIIKSIIEIKNQPDPIGKIIEKWEQPNGLKFSKISVPLSAKIVTRIISFSSVIVFKPL